MKYLEQIRGFYDPLFDLKIPVDIVPVDADFSRYKLVIAPLLYMVKPGMKERLESYVASGGNFITTFFSGIVDETDGVFPGGYPGPLKELLGIRVEEFDPLEAHMSNKTKIIQPWGNLNENYPCNLWCDVVIPGTAKILAKFTEDYHAKAPAITENDYSQGKSYYIATQLAPDFMREFLKHLCQINQIEAVLEAPSGVEVTRRSQKNGSDYFFVLNHNPDAVSVTLPNGRYQDLITEDFFEGEINLSAKEVRHLGAKD